MNNFKVLTDDELVGLYAQGNNVAFDTLLNRYESKLYSYIFILYTMKRLPTTSSKIPFSRLSPAFRKAATLAMVSSRHGSLALPTTL